MDCKKYVVMFSLFLFSLAVCAQTKGKLITLNFSDIPLSEAIRKIENVSDYTFFYDATQIDLKQKVSLNVERASANYAMGRMLKNTNLKYEITNTQIALFSKGKKLSGKKVTIKGQVVAPDGPVIGANVVEEGTSNGVITDMDGNYQLVVDSNSKIQISYIGFSTQTFSAGALPKVVELKEDSKQLQEIVVVGYGSQRKSDLTGGVTAVDEKKLELVSSNDLMDKLTGQVPGLSITTGNAQPGEDQTIRIRGNNSLTASNDPLIVLDGIPYSGSIGDIDPNIVANISVLKDASSAAIYGSRGANGVILIQTKKGAVGKAVVNYKGQVGMAETERRLDMMKGDEYIQYLRDLNHQLSGTPYEELTPETVLGADEYANYQAGRTIDWQDLMFRKALVTSHQISISGGTDRTTYMASLSHLMQNGVVENTGMKRTNVALNVTQDLNDWLKIGINMQAVLKNYGGVKPNLEAGIKMSPFGNYIDEEGNYVQYPMSRDNLFQNPMADINAVDDKVSRNVFVSTFAEIKLPVKGLSFRTNFGYNYRNRTEGIYYGRNTVTGAAVNGSASIENRHYSDYTWENILKYERTVREHKFDVTGLFSMQQTSNETSEQSAESFVSDASEYHNMAAGEKNLSVKSSLTETALLSYMLRFNYGYKGKYLFTLTGRSDGYSAFGKNNKYAFFPSAAVAWNMAAENFMENTHNWLDMMKLRLSYGSNGNQAINAYQTLDRLSSVKYIWGDGGTVANGVFLPTNGVGNPNLKWETTNTLNVGLDMSFFGGRLSGSIDVYLSNTKDLLMNRAVPYMNGYMRILDNIGSIRNVGVELSLSSINIQNENFMWTTSYNFSLNRDKITKLTDGATQDLTNSWFVGEPASVYYDYNVVGTWQLDESSWDEAQQKYLNAEGKEIQAGAKPGSAKLEDVNHDGIIDAGDKKIIGSKLPSFQMSMSNSFTYKNFFASFVLNGLFGQWKQMHDMNFDRWMKNFNYLSGMDYWTESNPTNEMTSITYVPFEKHSFYKKVNYVQIKNITVGYNLPKKALQAIGISAARIDLSVNNLYTFSNIRNALNYDNVLSNQDEKGLVIGYPTARSYMLGLNVTF